MLQESGSVAVKNDESEVFAVYSRGIRAVPNLASFLGREIMYGRFRLFARKKVLGVVVWGKKATAERIKALVSHTGTQIIHLEDGFLRSVGLGVSGAPPVSLVVDDLGIYYDGTTASRLERIIEEEDFSDDEIEAATVAIGLVKKHGLSKYNNAAPLVMKPKASRRVLVVDQTVGDMSVALGGGGKESFDRMLAAALAENYGSELWLKVHPDVIVGKRQGFFDIDQLTALGIRVISDECCPMALVKEFDKVYVVTSQLGFEALLQNREVVVFGTPWYAGWGVTDDRHPGMPTLRMRRTRNRTIHELFAAAYFRYSRYIRPATGAPGDIWDAIDWLARNKKINMETHGIFFCVGMSLWKRAIVAPFLSSPAVQLRFVRKLSRADLAGLPAQGCIVIWGSRDLHLAREAEEAGIPILRLEDGFIRSTGLGSDLYAPLSLVVDGPGMYYDPFSRSRLEQMLSTVEVDELQRSRAQRLREKLVDQKISKYNVGMPFRLDPASSGRKIILVPGQVEDDASIIAGSPFVRCDIDLLRLVRASVPDAWIVYKPHPDVVAGNRRGGVLGSLVDLADQVVLDANISDCIAAVDEVHTMTSLAGFEALLFGKRVHCYGGPFYAGWGLTEDHFELPHRLRRLSLDELVYVALCEYPRYRLPGVQGFCAVEDVVNHLAQRRHDMPRWPSRGIIAKQLRKVRQLARALVAGQ